MSATKTKWQQKREASYAALVRSAMQRFHERGYAATTVSDIVEGTGYSPGAFYFHFDNKADCFWHAVAYREGLRGPWWELVLEGLDPASAGLEEVLAHLRPLRRADAAASGVRRKGKVQSEGAGSDHDRGHRGAGSVRTARRAGRPGGVPGSGRQHRLHPRPRHARLRERHPRDRPNGQLTFAGASNDQALDPAFSPDGQRIAFHRTDGATGFTEIWVMNPDGSGQTPLTTGSATSEDFEPDFSPDGQRIVFYREDGVAQADIWVMNADGSGQAQLTSGPDNDLNPAFSPDGTRIAFTREDSAGTFSNILLADPAGLNQNVTPLTSSSPPVFDFDPTWQPLNPPSCELTGKATQKSLSQVSVTVTCPQENATAVLEGSGKAPRAPKGAVASKAKKFTIPAVTTQIPEGTPTAVTLKIPKKGKKALKKAAKAGRKGKATITATLTDDLGQSSEDSLAVKFKAKKK